MSPLLQVRASTSVAPACQRITVSPDYQRDHLVWCTWTPSSGVPQMAVSSSSGRSWRLAAMTGLSYTPQAFHTLSRVIPSPRFAQDHAAYVYAFGGGLQVTTDDGQTFQPVYPLGDDPSGGQGGALGIVNPYSQLTTTPVPVPALPAEHVYMTLPGDPSKANPSMRLDATMHAPQVIAGAPGSTVLFIVPPAVTSSSVPLALAYAPTASGGNGPLTVYSCTSDLACAQPLYTFAANLASPQVWVGPGPRTITVLFATTRQFWRSTDGGHTFALWRSANALVPGRYAGLPVLAVNPVRPNELFILEWSTDVAPALSLVRLHRSDNGGRTWHQVAYGEVARTGRMGDLPIQNATSGALFGLALLPDGRVLLSGNALVTRAGSQSAIDSVFCSLDGGLHWSALCPR
jgi:hypothetical protein